MDLTRHQKEKEQPVGRWVSHSIAMVLPVLTAFVVPNMAYAASRSPNVTTKFLSISGVSLKSLSEGRAGKGILIYYRNGKPVIGVRLTHAAGRPARADVYENLTSGPVTEIARETLGKPFLSMSAANGWWVRNGITNYNLSVKVYGPLYAMFGEPTYNKLLKPDELTMKILTHMNLHGIPQWDFRQLIPPLPGDGVLRSNYAQRTGPGPLEFLPSVSPMWPYVAYSGGYTQPNGELDPPIVVDWSTGKIEYFSEIVTVRGQDDSYDFYSITPITLGKVNHPDFEAPWGFYNLAGKEDGYPTLIIRNEHYFADDYYSTGVARYLLGTSGIPKPNEVIRYSWADHPGNNMFNYMVNVFGFHPYTTKVPIMNGRTWVVAPAYHSYPEWVIDHNWPITTFIDTNGGGYATTEGIYQWSSRTSLRYLLGWTSHPNLSEFQSILKGFRGEYRLGAARRPLLYMSPIDHEVHLLYAQAGLWNLGGGSVLREENEDGGPFLNVWQLWQPTSSLVKPRSVKKRSKSLSEVAQLAIADGYALDSGPKGVTIDRMSNSSQSLGTIAPPTTHDTWLSFKHTVSKLDKGANPINLADWVASIPGARMRIIHSTLSDLHITATGFQFVLAESKAVVTGKFLGLRIPSLTGTYVVDYSKDTKTWRAVPGSPAKLSASTRTTEAPKALYPTNIIVSVSNYGSEPWDGPIRVTVGSEVLSRETQWIGGGSKEEIHASWTPAFSGSHDIRVYVGNRLVDQTPENVASSSRGSIATLVPLSLPGNPELELAMILMFAILIVGGGVVVWRRVT